MQQMAITLHLQKTNDKPTETVARQYVNARGETRPRLLF